MTKSGGRVSSGQTGKRERVGNARVREKQENNDIERWMGEPTRERASRCECELLEDIELPYYNGFPSQIHNCPVGKSNIKGDNNNHATST